MAYKGWIPWAGSKRKQAADIVDNFPAEVNNLIIPFIGSGGELREILSRVKINGNIIINDINQDLMALWRDLVYRPSEIIDNYERLYNIINMSGLFYEAVKAEYNNDVSDSDDEIINLNNINKHHLLYALIRGSMRGEVKYKDGKFVSSWGKRMATPSTVESNIMAWHNALEPFKDRISIYNDEVSKFLFLQMHNIEGGDLVFLDPPYMNSTWYYGDDSADTFWLYLFESIESLPCDYFMTLNGNIEEYPIPEHLYTEYKYIYYSQKAKEDGIRSSRDTLWMRKLAGLDYSGPPQILQESVDAEIKRRGARGGGGNIGTNINLFQMIEELNKTMQSIDNSLKNITDALELRNQYL